MEDPDILLLDEPLNGLDNEGVEEIRKVLLSLKEKGKLIILARSFERRYNKSFAIGIRWILGN